MLNFILRWTIYLPYNLWIITKSIFKRPTKPTINIDKIHVDRSMFYQEPKTTKHLDPNDPNVVKIDCNYLPERKSAGAAGYDLIAKLGTPFILVRANETVLIPTGLKIEIPRGKVGLVFVRSSLSISTPLTLANGVGVIDSDYRGEIQVPLRNTSGTKRATINNGDRIAQLVIVDYYAPQLMHSKVLEETTRGSGGFGSTGVK